MEKYAIIPKEKIDRIELYINEGRKTLAQIVSESGASYALNGGLFNLSKPSEAYCPLKANGSVYAKDNRYSYDGYAWNNTAPLQLIYGDYSQYDNFISCVCMVKNGKKAAMYYSADVGRAAQRTAVGLFPDGRLWLYVTDKKLTPPELQNIALNEGLDSAIMLDGGGSTQGYFNGELIPAERKVHNLILVYLKAEATIQPEVTAERIVALAASQVGIAETATNRIKYNTEYYGSAVSGSAFSWCCVFIWWLFHSLGADKLFYNGEKTASCTTLYRWAASEGLAIYGGYQPGDVVFYDWNGSGDCDHVGIVENVDGNTVYTIEGNQNDAVTRVSRSTGDISAAYRPAYKVTASELGTEFAALAEEFDRFALAFANFSEKLKKVPFKW